MIRAIALTKTYPMHDRTMTALDHVSLHVPPGQYAAIVGSSGSGKSTLMHLLGCLDTPTSGAYYLRGRDVSQLPPRELAQVRGAEIGFVFQGFQLIPRLTALENVALPLLLCGVPRRERLARAQSLLERVGLGQRLHHRPSQLSGGQQQRVAVARALARDPALILADEPTGNLDGEATGEVLALLDALHREGRTILLITHDPRVAARAQRQICISRGQMIADSDQPFMKMT
ncbi:MAG: ABC transporter ATP-binding protein [Clostridia bacterium]|nr:ABC transporter ATP-binding protein [Clostridia bacterium]